MQEYKIVKSILKDFVDEDFIDYDEEENSFITPFCMLQEHDDVWYISFNLSFDVDIRSIIVCTEFVKELMNHQIMVEIDTAYYAIVDEETDKIIEVLWDSDIYKFMVEGENKYQYEEARELMIKKIKEDNKGIQEVNIDTKDKELH